MSTDGILGFEALARFQCMPLRSPDTWFDEAHEVSRGVELELLALKLAVAKLDDLPAHAYLAVNLSPQTIIAGSLADCLAGVSLNRLVLEVTEHVPVDEYECLTVALEPLRRAGAKLAIDDAGSGYASFRHILQLRPDIIKLYRSLIHDIHLDQGKRAGIGHRLFCKPDRQPGRRRRRGDGRRAAGVVRTRRARSARLFPGEAVNGTGAAHGAVPMKDSQSLRKQHHSMLQLIHN